MRYTRDLTNELAIVMEEEVDENFVVLTDAAGDEIGFEFLDLIEYFGKEYAVFLPLEDDDEEVVILQLESSNDNTETYLAIEDDYVLNAVYNIFKEKYKDEFNFADGTSDEQYVSSGQQVKYRSRLGLLFIAWLSAFAGGHYNWMGFSDAGREHRAQYGVLRAVFNPACWIIHIWEQIAITFGKYREDAYGNPIRYFAFVRNLKNK